jgi:xanthine/CO dehydrogenase XdhC/CoxF family maturation factor
LKRHRRWTRQATLELRSRRLRRIDSAGPGPGGSTRVDSPGRGLVIVGGGTSGALWRSRRSSATGHAHDERKEFMTAVPDNPHPAATGEAMKTILRGAPTVRCRTDSADWRPSALARKKARYIGMIGSKRRVETVLRAPAIWWMRLGRLHAPIGLISAETRRRIATRSWRRSSPSERMGRGAGSLRGGRTK